MYAFSLPTIFVELPAVKLQSSWFSWTFELKWGFDTAKQSKWTQHEVFIVETAFQPIVWGNWVGKVLYWCCKNYQFNNRQREWRGDGWMYLGASKITLLCEFTELSLTPWGRSSQDKPPTLGFVTRWLQPASS